MPTNDFLQYAAGGGANVDDQATYAADPQTTNGQQTGIADSKNFNKMGRQANAIVSALAQVCVNVLALDMLDNGNQADKVTKIQNTIIAICAANPAASAAKWTTARNLSFTGDATGVGSVDGSANVATALTLATVNANVGTFGGGARNVPQFTVNGKGLITGAANVTTSFKSANLGNPTANAQYSVPHGLGSTPSSVRAYIVCTTGNLSYAVGAVVAVGFGGSSRNDGVSAWASPANVGVNIGSNSIYIIPNDGSGSGAQVTAADWQIYIVAEL